MKYPCKGARVQNVNVIFGFLVKPRLGNGLHTVCFTRTSRRLCKELCSSLCVALLILFITLELAVGQKARKALFCRGRGGSIANPD